MNIRIYLAEANILFKQTIWQWFYTFFVVVVFCYAYIFCHTLNSCNSVFYFFSSFFLRTRLHISNCYLLWKKKNSTVLANILIHNVLFYFPHCFLKRKKKCRQSPPPISWWKSVNVILQFWMCGCVSVYEPKRKFISKKLSNSFVCLHLRRFVTSENNPMSFPYLTTKKEAKKIAVAHGIYIIQKWRIVWQWNWGRK